MTEIVSTAYRAMKPLGFAIRSHALWRRKDDVYQLIHFQTSVYNRSVVFVNVCCHPVGLPPLLAKRLQIVAHPKEYECILSIRLEHLLNPELRTPGREPVAFTDHWSPDVNIVSHLVDGLYPWFERSATLAGMLALSDDELTFMLTVMPLIRTKASAMLRCYCAARLGRHDEAERHCREFLAAPAGGYDFAAVDRFMSDLVESRV